MLKSGNIPTKPNIICLHIKNRVLASNYSFGINWTWFLIEQKHTLLTWKAFYRNSHVLHKENKLNAQYVICMVQQLRIGHFRNYLHFKMLTNQTLPNFLGYWYNKNIYICIKPKQGRMDKTIEWREAEIRLSPQIHYLTFNESEAFRSSLITDDRASGLIPCSQRRTHIDRDSMSNPVFNSLDISRRTGNVRAKHSDAYVT